MQRVTAHSGLVRARATVNSDQSAAKIVAAVIIATALAAGLSSQRRKRENKDRDRCLWVEPSVGESLEAKSDVKPPALAQGIITTLVKHQRYGFIAPDAGGRDIFFRTFALTGATLDQVDEGDRVLFELEPGSDADERGPRARMVRPYQGRPASTGPTADTFRPLPRHRSSRAKKPGWRKS